MHTNNSSHSDEAEIFREITRELDQLGIEYALLHPGNTHELDFSSDIDIVLDRPPPLALEPIILKLANQGKAQLVQRLHYDAPHGYYYVLRILTSSGHTYLQLDCLYDPYGINRYHLSSTQLLRNRVPFGDYHRIAANNEAEYLIIKRSLKRNAAPENIKDLFEIIHSSSADSLERLRYWLGADSANQVLMHCKEGDFNHAARLIRSSGRHIEKTFRRNHPIKSAARLLWNFYRNIARFFRPTGFFVVLIGPDGCGKSTISDGLRQHMQRAFRSTWRFHWRPKLLPKLRNSKRSDQTQGTVPDSAPPTEKSKYSGFVSLARYIYYWLDFVAGYWLIIYPRKARSTLIVGERYFPDILVHPERYGFSVPKWIVRATGAMVPKPDLLIFLTGDPQSIHNRKPELPVDVIADQLRKYATEITNWGDHLPVNTCQPVNTVLEQLENRISQSLQNKIIPPRHPTSVKYAFPSFGRTRALIDNKIPTGALQDIFNPQNKIARLMVKAVDFAPRPMLPLFAKRSPSAYYGTFPVDETDIFIHERLSDDTLSISYYMGNGGPRSKITAQATSRRNNPVFVKIAESEAAQALLRNEKFALENITSENESAPRILDLATKNGWLYLFVTGPSSNFHRSGLALTNGHERYVGNIALNGLHELSFQEFVKKHSFIDRVSRLEQSPYSEIIGDTGISALRLSQNHFSTGPIKAYRNHGDFVPWNILIDDQDNIFTYDWEYSEASAPAFSDLFHFLRSTRQFAMHMSPSRTATEILDPDASHAKILSAHAQRLKIDICDIPCYLLLYLVTEILRHAETGSEAKTQAYDPGQAAQIRYLADCATAVIETIKQGHRPLRILVSAYACEPDKGSEPGVGWNWAKLIATNNLTWVVTRSNNRESIQNALSLTPNHNLKFIYVDLPKWARFWKSKQRGVRTYYYLWQFWALSASRKLHRKERFDLAHHVTFVNDWLWSFLALMPIPFIWGPIGSHPPAPFALLPHFRAKTTEFIRIAIQRTMRTIDPLYWLTAIRARKIIPINKEICGQFPLNLVGQGKAVIEPAIAFEDSAFTGDERSNDTFSVLYVGRFHYTKCPHLAIHAFARFVEHTPDSRLTMIGRGPEEDNLRALAEQLDCSDKISFVPWLAQPDVFSEMSRSDIFLFPSTEGGGMVVIEAMANRLPVICLDYGGPGEMVCTQCGAKAPTTSADVAVDALHTALTRFHADREALITASDAAAHHARETLSWREKGHRIDAMYEQVMSGK